MSRFTKISRTGKPLPDTAKTWAAVLDSETGLMWQADQSKQRATFTEAATIAADLTLAGHSDWRVPTRKELVSLIDDSRHNPAIDVDYFPKTKSTWYWSASPCAWAPGSFAWVVYFGSGGVYNGGQNYAAFVRAVRSASVPGQ
jgi:hypothetical protein